MKIAALRAAHTFPTHAAVNMAEDEDVEDYQVLCEMPLFQEDMDGSPLHMELRQSVIKSDRVLIPKGRGVECEECLGHIEEAG